MPSMRVRPPLHRDPAENTFADDAGFTVIECLVSFILLAIVSASAVFAIVEATATDKNSSDRTVAQNLAQSDENAAQALRYPTYPAAITGKTIKVGTTNYTVTRTVSSACPMPPSYDTNPFMTVTTTVTWPPAGTNQRVVMAQELAC
jgi:type II secretory pathway pseudopilin PulG